MPREMHVRSLDGTRWTSTSSAATLKAPHGGSMAALDALAGCAPGMSCECPACAGRTFKVKSTFEAVDKAGVVKTGTGQTFKLQGAEVPGSDASFLGARVEPVVAGQKQGVQAEVYVFGQPPLDAKGTVDRASLAMLELGMPDAKVSAKAYTLQWSWSYDPSDKSWTAYVSNADAGPFVRLLDKARSYFVQYDTPVADDLKRLPTDGFVVQALGEFPKAMTVQERTRVIKTFKPFRPLGADLFFALRFYSVPRASKAWIFGLAAIGGLAYFRSRA